MKHIRKFGAWAAALALGSAALPAGAELFFTGKTKGVRGENVELIINARAGTELEAIDIVPEFAAVAGILDFEGFESMPALEDDGSGLCTDDSCSFFYVPTKVFAADTPLARMRFKIDAAAPIGTVPFNPGIVLGEDDIALPAASQFEVMAIPEPEAWAMLGVGLAVVAAVGARRRGAR
jgi:hypothetical protein